VGSVLQLERDLAAVGVHAEFAGTDCFYFSFEALSADVCGYWNFDGQRTTEEIEELGAMDGAAMQEAVPS
jgi:hypothetical protein